MRRDPVRRDPVRRDPDRPTRRAVLAGGLLLPLTACTGSDDAPVGPATVDPDVALRAAAVARERQLLATYDALLQQDPARADRLAPLRAEHAEHLAALGEQEALATAFPARAPTLPPGGFGGLAQAERAAAAAHADATAAASPALAALLAQLAASEASHPVALA